MGLAAGVLAYAASYLFAPRYESYATYYFPMSSPSPTAGLAQLSGITPGDKGSIGGLNGALSSPLIGSAPQTAIGIFSSRSCRELVLKDLAAQGQNVQDLTEKKLGEMTDVKQDRNGMVRLEVDSATPEFSQTVVKAYQKAFESIAQKLTLNVSKRNRMLIEKRLHYLKGRADELERQTLEAVARPNSIDLDLAKEALTEAEKQRIEAGQKRAGVEAKLRSLVVELGRIYDSESKHPGLNGTPTSPLIAALEERRLAFEDARKAFQPGSAELERAERDYVTASRLIGGLAKNKQALAAAGIDPQAVEAVSDYAGLRAAERELNNQIANLKKRATDSASGPHTVDGLKADLLQVRKTISQLDSEYQLALIAEARDPSRFEVLDEPEADPRSVFPRRLLIAGLAAAIVFLFMAGRTSLRIIRSQEAAIE